MSKYPRRRDACEKPIVAALRSAGATVTQLDGPAGVPDLLVGFKGATLLLECKDPELGARNSRSGSGKKVGNDLGLRDSQFAWWSNWKGGVPVVVTTAAEALELINNLATVAVSEEGTLSKQEEPLK